MESKTNQFHAFDSFLASFTLGEPQAHKNLTIFPVFTNNANGNKYAMLKDALKTKNLVITEVTEGGTVPNLKVTNKLEEDVLILDGEELVGAKQNRVLNTTIIVGRKKVVVVPVSCVEQGRWRYKKRSFDSGDSSLYSDLRKEKLKSVTENLKMRRSFESDQQEVWASIESKAQRMSVNSDTGAMHDIYENYEQRIDSYEKAFAPHKTQAGFIAVIDGTVAGCDVFSSHEIFRKAFKSLVKGYILDALDSRMSGHLKRKKKTAQGDPGQFLTGIKKMKRHVFKSAGEGDDVRLEGKHANGSALMHNEQVVHLSAFAE